MPYGYENQVTLKVRGDNHYAGFILISVKERHEEIVFA